MGRTWKQTAYVLAAWALAAAVCLAAWGAGYHLGWVQGYDNAVRGTSRQRLPTIWGQLFADEPSERRQAYVSWLSASVGESGSLQSYSQYQQPFTR